MCVLMDLDRHVHVDAHEEEEEEEEVHGRDDSGNQEEGCACE